MSIDLVKVSPPSRIQSNENIETTYLRGGRGNAVLVSWSSNSTTNNIGYSKGSVEEKTNSFCLSDVFRSNEIKNMIHSIEEVIPDKFIVTIKRWFKRHILIFVLNYISNEVLYEKLVNILSDDLVFEEE